MAMICYNCGKSISTGDERCQYCGAEQSAEALERFMETHAVYQEDARHCPKCGREYLDDESVYCVYCGEKRQPGIKGRYRVESLSEMACIYGPPPEILTYICSSCGAVYKWSSWNEDRVYCPACGGVLSVNGHQLEPGRYGTTVPHTTGSTVTGFQQDGLDQIR